jgi:hypothetical protein
VRLYTTTAPPAEGDLLAQAEGKQVAFVGLPGIERIHIFAAAIS